VTLRARLPLYHDLVNPRTTPYLLPVGVVYHDPQPAQADSGLLGIFQMTKPILHDSNSLNPWTTGMGAHRVTGSGLYRGPVSSTDVYDARFC
jgi:hypothetical protein